MEESTIWAALLRGIVGPLLMFLLFGAAWLGATLIWKIAPDSKARRWLFQPLTPVRATVLLMLATIVIGAGLVLNEALPDLHAFFGA